MDDEQQRRVARNEARLRDLNERQVDAASDFHDSQAAVPVDVVCECAVTECDQTFAMPWDEYQHVRSDPRWFAVRPDHVIESVERRVEDHGEYWIVEKHAGPGATVAEQTA